MRKDVTARKLQIFMEELAARAQSPGNVYFTGGATALLFGMRKKTIDLDIRFEPDPRGVFEAIAKLKNKLDINIELASPADFIPVTSDWKTKSIFIALIGHLGFYHYDLRAQALAKIERGYAQDIMDARGFLSAGKISKDGFQAYLLAVKPGFLRYPAIDVGSLEAKVKRFLEKE